MEGEKKQEVAICDDKNLSHIEISEETIENLIYVIRGHQVMLDSDLAMLYQVETGALNRAVKRNIKRFPEDFCFQLTDSEYKNLKCQFGISSFEERDMVVAGICHMFLQNREYPCFPQYYIVKRQ